MSCLYNRFPAMLPCPANVSDAPFVHEVLLLIGSRYLFSKNKERLGIVTFVQVTSGNNVAREL